MLYPEDIVTEETMRDVTEEIIREKILLRRDLFRMVRMEPFSSLRNGICLPSHL